MVSSHSRVTQGDARDVLRAFTNGKEQAIDHRTETKFRVAPDVLAAGAMSESHTFKPRTCSRRAFVTGIGAVGTFEACRSSRFAAALVHSQSAEKLDRAYRVHEMRLELAREERDRPRPMDATNGDDDIPTHFASYSKALPHDNTGLVDGVAYAAMLKALSSGRPDDFRAIPLGGNLRLSNPQSAYSYTLAGVDSARIELPTPPAFASQEAAADMAEVYWHAVLRDIPFDVHDGHSAVEMAATDLTEFKKYQGPRENGRVTASLLFRGQTSGDRVGPYVSQFLYARIPNGVYSVEQRFRMPCRAGLRHHKRRVAGPATWRRGTRRSDP
jgi:hypothetical protein